MADAMIPVPRLAVFGDSHYACVRQAQTLGLVDVSGVDIEYWGHIGRRFNFLEYQDGAIRPTDDVTAARFAKFNEKGRLFLPAADFDMILFVGTRTYVNPVFRVLLAASQRGPFLSSGLKRRIVADHLGTHSGYQLARKMAAAGAARIVLSPIAFPTQGYPRIEARTGPEMRAASPAALAEIWDLAVSVAASDGITLIRQPPQTIVDSVFTKPEFAIDQHVEKQDFEHHSPAFGALILSQAIALLRMLPGGG